MLHSVDISWDNCELDRQRIGCTIPTNKSGTRTIIGFSINMHIGTSKKSARKYGSD